MRLIINSKILGKREFWIPDNGGYVRLEMGGIGGIFGTQICRGGGFTGSTLSASPESLAKVCRMWHRQNLKKQQGYF